MRYSAGNVAKALLAASLAAAPLGTTGLSTAEWKRQSIYQVLTDRFAQTDGSTTAACDDLRAYCGGTYQGIIGQLDYIQGMGFTAIWISPIVKNIEGYTSYGNAFHGFWAQDIWSLNPHFGTEDDLKALSDALHNRGMYLMVDIVTNHMGYNGCGECVDYSTYTEFNSADYFHPFCLIDYSSETSVHDCWQGDNQVSLPDLRTEDTGIREVFNRWIKELVPKYGIDGLRIDSTKHVEKDFWPDFGDAAGVYMVGEVYEGDPDVLAGYSGYIDGVMNYAAFYWMKNAFNSASSTVNELISGINKMKAVMDTTTLGSFLENHDQARFPSLTSDIGRIKTAITFAMLSDGIPIVYQGQEQQFSGAEDPNNREAVWLSGYNTNHQLYRLVASVNQVRNHAVANGGTDYVDYRAVPARINDYALALRKGQPGGQIVGVFSNMGESGVPYTVTLAAGDTGFTGGQQVIEILTCEVSTANSAGNLDVQITAAPRILYPLTRVTGSGICGK